MSWGWTQEIERVRARLERKITDAVTGILLSTLTSASSPLGDSDAVQSYDDGKDPESDTKAQRPVVRILPFGFASRQPAGVRGITLRFGSSNALFIGIIPTQKYGPQSLNVGESALYAKPGQTVLCDQNGNIVSTPAGSGTVQLGGSSHPLPLWDSFASTLATFANTIALLPPATTLPTAITAINGVITAANTLNNSMSSNSNYKSTKAFNG